jgi:hypothetical protein
MYGAPMPKPILRFSRVGALAGVVLVGFALASCSSSTSSSETTTTTSKSTIPVSETACAFVSTEAVDTIMNVSVQSPIPDISNSVTTCTYKATDKRKSVIIEYDKAASPTSFQKDMSTIQSKGVQTSSVTGIGQQAFGFTESSPDGNVNTIVVLQNQLQLIVTGTSSIGDVKALAAATLQAVEARSGESTPTTSP